MAWKQKLAPESLVARIVAELQENPEAQRMLLRALLTNEFLGMPARLDRVEKDIAELKVDVKALKADVAELKTTTKTLVDDVGGRGSANERTFLRIHAVRLTTRSRSSSSAGQGPRRRARAEGAGRGDRLRQHPDQPAPPGAGWRCLSPACAAIARTRAPTRHDRCGKSSRSDVGYLDLQVGERFETAGRRGAQRERRSETAARRVVLPAP